MNFEAVGKKDSIAMKLDPRIKLMWFTSISLVVILWDDPLLLLGVFLYELLFAGMAGIPVKRVFKSVAPILPILIVLFIANFFLYTPPVKHPTLLGHLLPASLTGGEDKVPIYLETLIYSFGAAFRFVCILASAMILLMITTPTELATGLVKLGAPSEIGLAVSIAIGYVPVLFKQITGILEAQQSRGWNAGGRNPVKKMINYMPIMIPTFFRSMNSSDHLAAAMTSRGFGYNIKGRTYLNEIKFRKNDKIAFFILMLLIVLGILLGVLNLARYTDNTLVIVKMIFHIS